MRYFDDVAVRSLQLIDLDSWHLTLTEVSEGKGIKYYR
jgi:hypothetical protein